MFALKTNGAIGDPARGIAGEIAEHVRRDPAHRILEKVLSGRATLVPTPKSSLLAKGGLWVPFELAQAFLQAGLGDRVACLLERAEPLPKSATSLAAHRPLARNHFETLRLHRDLLEPEEILLVDDVVTRGSTLLGSASRLAEAFPKARIHAFAAMRTISEASDFVQVVEPIMGKIVLRPDGSTLRRP
jgi:hypothetical protein